MDRNKERKEPAGVYPVALRKESVDRNTDLERQSQGEKQVALRKESVDRNCIIVMVGLLMFRSLSARRAWIEIDMPHFKPYAHNGRSPQGERG